jgi:hypothetical protein
MRSACDLVLETLVAKAGFEGEAYVEGVEVLVDGFKECSRPQSEGTLCCTLGVEESVPDPEGRVLCCERSRPRGEGTMLWP